VTFSSVGNRVAPRFQPRGLAMSVIISVFGMVNILVLSVYERTREIGMVRAIGTTRGASCDA
jgi:hypothetical protein